MVSRQAIRVLVADPNSSLRRITLNMLKELGFECLQEVQDGLSALNVITERGVDLVVSEWTMPGMSGIELLGTVRESRRHAELPFVMLTSEAGQESILQAAKSGVSAYLIRPLSASRLDKKIEEVLKPRAGALQAPAPATSGAGEPTCPDPAPETQGDTPIELIVEQGNILTFFHPVVSIRRRAILGFEALSRGFHPTPTDVVMPDAMFELAAAKGLSGELDTLCQDKALANFSPLYAASNQLLLFLKINPGPVAMGPDRLEDLGRRAAGLGLSASNVVLQVEEPSIEDTEELYRLVSEAQKLGFLVAFDKVGRHSIHLDTIALLRPDIVKVDRLLMRDIDTDYYRQQTLKALANMSRKAGAMIMASGLERPGEILATLDTGIEVMQGYYFSRPSEGVGLKENFQAKIEVVSSGYGKHARERIAKSKERYRGVEGSMDGLVAMLVGLGAQALDPRTFDPKSLDQALDSFMSAHPEVDCIYILDEDGVQVSRGHHASQDIPERKRLVSQPHHAGENHALKDYYQHLMAGYDRYVTESFISRVSGRLVRTVARRFSTSSGQSLIACLDVLMDD